MTESKNGSLEQACYCGSGIDRSKCCAVEGRNALNADIYAYVTTKGVTSEDALTPEMQTAIDSIAENPQLFPARVNLFTDKAWYIKMSPATYRDSIFLDPGRMMGTCLVESKLDWLKDVCEKIQWQPTSFIFHSAFCGSTLMSQILDSVFNCLSLREPELLSSILVYNRSQANEEDKTFWFESSLKLLSRRFASDQGVVVKANDFANPLMSDLTQWQEDLPILFMYIPLGEFIAACMKAENRQEWVKQRYQAIKPFIAGVFDLNEEPGIDEDDLGKLAAVYWAYNISAYLQIARSNSKQIKSLEFNDMLSNPIAAVEQTGQLFNLKPNGKVDVDAEVGNLMGVYSKNSNFRYSPEQRRGELRKQQDQFAKELASGEKFARKLLGENYPDTRLPGNLLES